MRSVAAILGACSLLWPVQAMCAAQFDRQTRVAPDVVVLHVKAGKDGTIADVDFEIGTGEAAGRIPSGLLRLTRNRIAGQGDVDWKSVITAALHKLRDEQKLNEQCIVRIAAPDDLNFGTAAAIAQCCRKVGFRHVEFAVAAPGRVTLVVAADGTVTADGKTLTDEAILPYLAEKARVFGGTTALEIAIHAHPSARFVAVARLLRTIKGGGYSQVRVEARNP